MSRSCNRPHFDPLDASAFQHARHLIDRAARGDYVVDDGNVRGLRRSQHDKGAFDVPAPRHSRKPRLLRCFSRSRHEIGAQRNAELTFETAPEFDRLVVTSLPEPALSQRDGDQQLRWRRPKQLDLASEQLPKQPAMRNPAPVLQAADQVIERIGVKKRTPGGVEVRWPAQAQAASQAVIGMSARRADFAGR